MGVGCVEAYGVALGGGSTQRRELLSLLEKFANPHRDFIRFRFFLNKSVPLANSASEGDLLEKKKAETKAFLSNSGQLGEKSKRRDAKG